MLARPLLLLGFGCTRGSHQWSCRKNTCAKRLGKVPSVHGEPPVCAVSYHRIRYASPPLRGCSEIQSRTDRECPTAGGIRDLSEVRIIDVEIRIIPLRRIQHVD